MNGCLLIHGFTGGPYEVDPLARYLRQHTDWKIVVPTLPGHGETLDLKGKKADEWVKHAEEELKALLEECEEVYVIGFSMGGLIASYLSVEYPVGKLVLLSAAAYYVNPKQLLVDIREVFRDVFKGELANNELYLRYKKKIKDTPISATYQFRKVVMMAKPLLKDIKIPVFIAQGKKDGIVPPKSADFLYEEITYEEKVRHFSEEAKHLICHSDDSEELFQKVKDFLVKEK
ncbi:alpha/beta fold hydrolase [Bacillus salacetis]|uniref:Alpha/beta fold hydrolase n=1 Tax=Bacillus salacetis TaxID=2315464 RepID=A0A3A1QWI9_9BACI|nr:alpha/beta fold hydrolase [Bacillus salacetis]RIW32737.1 alpha/beta fold hydrolase [Bacillus salacetis]